MPYKSNFQPNRVSLFINGEDWQDVVILDRRPNKYWGVKRYQELVLNDGLKPNSDEHNSLLNITFPESSRALEVFKNHFLRAMRESVPDMLRT